MPLTATGFAGLFCRSYQNYFIKALYRPAAISLLGYYDYRKTLIIPKQSGPNYENVSPSCRRANLHLSTNAIAGSRIAEVFLPKRRLPVSANLLRIYQRCGGSLRGDKGAILGLEAS